MIDLREHEMAAPTWPNRAQTAVRPWRRRAVVRATLAAIAAGVLGAVMMLQWTSAAAVAEEPEFNPFGAAQQPREDAVPGYVLLSDGTVVVGNIYLTRDKRLQLYDAAKKRQREIPLSAVRQIEAKVTREWMEREWKFKELTRDEKMYTGRSYPAREYRHVVTLRDGGTIEGDLSALIFVAAPSAEESSRSSVAPASRAIEPQRFVLHKRDKGEVGTELKSLVYVQTVALGDEAYREGVEKAAQAEAKKNRKANASPRAGN